MLRSAKKLASLSCSVAMTAQAFAVNAHRMAMRNVLFSAARLSNVGIGARKAVDTAVSVLRARRSFESPASMDRALDCALNQQIFA